MPGLPSFVFVCPSNWGFAELHREHGSEALADVLALEVVLLLLQQPAVTRHPVQGRGQRRAEPGEVEPPSWVLTLFANEKTDSA